MSQVLYHKRSPAHIKREKTEISHAVIIDSSEEEDIKDDPLFASIQSNIDV